MEGDLRGRGGARACLGQMPAAVAELCGLGEGGQRADGEVGPAAVDHLAIGLRPALRRLPFQGYFH